MGLKISGFLLSVDFPFLNGTALQFFIIIKIRERAERKRSSSLSRPEIYPYFLRDMKHLSLNQEPFLIVCLYLEIDSNLKDDLG